MRLSILLSWLLMFLACSFSAKNLAAQSLDHVQGQILIQVNESPDGQSLKSWLANFQDRNGKALPLKYEKLVSKPVNIHLVEFDFSALDEREVLYALRRHPLVTNAQFNHFVKNRAVPNDPEFNNQWQYINTGQGGGTVGADLDMELAWDYTTGGVTAMGDTIVACIIDDGIDSNHPDIAPNLWVNRFEIPNNGIDDDNNGFVDDYRGWDTGADNDAVYDGGVHGTPVTGIIGARGNDGFGVAGVNWNVKLMIVQGGTGVESEVLEAYSYPLVARQRYNETDGAEGAFVVTTNASWGLDFGQPADAPLWCAFYDTLGVHGILNCGATVNNDVDVDTQGDLPTACPSDYLIAVTNIDRNDQKITAAGYGLESIDLGAFGAETWTTTAGSGFGPFGGTSGATPHVAGAVALLYSLPCASLIELAKTNPSSVALIVKNAILEGVDFNASLQGITTTGGRMNVHNAVLNVLAQCGGCPQPILPVVTADSDTSAAISFSLISDTVINQVNLRYRPVGDTVWVTMDDVSSPLMLDDLMGCTNYEFQLQSECDTTNSDFSDNYFFSTLGCCENPATFTATVIDSSSIQFDWSDVFAAQFYILENRIAGTQDWSADTINDNTFLLSELPSCSDIEYRLRLVCSDTTATDYTGVQQLTTMGCGACLDLSYCDIPGISTVDEWISSVVIGEFSNNSGASNSGYEDFTLSGPSASLNAGSDYEVLLTPSFSGTLFNEGWGIFIDFNQDGDFEDASERIFQASLSSSPASGSISIPEDAQEGYTRMRVIMLYEAIPNGCASNHDGYGEAEDYCVTILPPLPTCANVELAQDSSQVNTNAEIFLAWNAINPTDNYAVRYRVENTIPWIEAETSETQIGIDGLENCTTYEFQILTECLTGTPSDYSESIFISTDCLPVCDLPQGLVHDMTTDPNSDSTVIVNWLPTVEGTTYNVRYRLNGVVDEWLEASTIDSVIMLMGLDSCTTYEIQIQADCGDGSIASDYSESILATTACISSSRFNVPAISEWSIAPNPARNAVNIQYSIATSPAKMGARMFDQYGRQVRYQQIAPNGSGQVQIDLSDLAAGVYYLRLETENGQSRVKKLVKF